MLLLENVTYLYTLEIALNCWYSILKNVILYINLITNFELTVFRMLKFRADFIFFMITFIHLICIIILRLMHNSNF